MSLVLAYNIFDDLIQIVYKYIYIYMILKNIIKVHYVNYVT